MELSETKQDSSTGGGTSVCNGVRGRGDGIEDTGRWVSQEEGVTED